MRVNASEVIRLISHSFELGAVASFIALKTISLVQLLEHCQIIRPLHAQLSFELIFGDDALNSSSVTLSRFTSSAIIIPLNAVTLANADRRSCVPDSCFVFYVIDSDETNRLKKAPKAIDATTMIGNAWLLTVPRALAFRPSDTALRRSPSLPAP